MKDEIKWEILDEIQSLYFGKAFEYIKCTPNENLKENFGIIDSSYFILRLLGSFTYQDIKEEIDYLFDEIVEFSLDGNPTQIILARKIICLIDRNFLDEKLKETIQSIVMKKRTEEDYCYLFENIKNLLFSLGFND